MTWPNGAADAIDPDEIFKLNPADTDPPALSFTPIVNENEPATVGIPAIVPEEDNERPAGRPPLERDQE